MDFLIRLSMCLKNTGYSSRAAIHQGKQMTIVWKFGSRSRDACRGGGIHFVNGRILERFRHIIGRIEKIPAGIRTVPCPRLKNQS